MDDYKDIPIEKVSRTWRPTNKISETDKTVLNKKQSYEKIGKIFHDYSDDDPLFQDKLKEIFFNLAHKLSKYTKIDPEPLREFDILHHISYYFKTISNTSFGTTGDDIYITIARLVYHLLRLGVCCSDDLYHYGITHIYKAITKQIHILKADIAVSLFYRNMFPYEDQELHEHIIKPFFRVAATCYESMQIDEAKILSLEFLHDFILYEENVTKKHVWRVNKCCYEFINKDNELSDDDNEESNPIGVTYESDYSLYICALETLGILLKRFPDQGVVFYKHFSSRVFSLINSMNTKLATAAMLTTTKFVSIDGTNITAVENLPISSVMQNLDSFSDAACVAALRLISSIAKIGPDGVMLLLQSGVLDSFASIFQDMPVDSKKGMTLALADMLENCPPEHCVDFILQPATAIAFETTSCTNPFYPVRMMTVFQTAISKISGTPEYDRLMECIMDTPIPDIIEDLAENSPHERVVEICSEFLDKVQGNDNE